MYEKKAKKVGKALRNNVDSLFSLALVNKATLEKVQVAVFRELRSSGTAFRANQLRTQMHIKLGYGGGSCPVAQKWLVGGFNTSGALVHMSMEQEWQKRSTGCSEYVEGVTERRELEFMLTVLRAVLLAISKVGTLDLETMATRATVVMGSCCDTSPASAFSIEC